MSDFPNLSWCLTYGRVSKYVLNINAAFKVTVTIWLLTCIHPLIKMRACRMPVLLKNPHIKHIETRIISIFVPFIYRISVTYTGGHSVKV